MEEGVYLGLNYNGYNISIIGANHIINNVVCQDYSLFYKDDECAIAVICDGHGDKRYFRSDIGSKIACEIGIDAIRTFLSNENVFIEFDNNNIVNRIKQLERFIIYKWNMEVNNHFNNNPLISQELENLSPEDIEKFNKNENIEKVYGTTFLAVGIKSNFWFSIQIGDSDCCIMNSDSSIFNPLPKDEKCQFNYTTSLCDKDAISSFVHYFSNELPDSIIITTDGIRNSFKNEEFFYKFINQIYLTFKEMTFDDAKKEIEDYLPKLSSDGSGDDLSISIIYKADCVNTKC